LQFAAVRNTKQLTIPTFQFQFDFESFPRWPGGVRAGRKKLENWSKNLKIVFEQVHRQPAAGSPEEGLHTPRGVVGPECRQDRNFLGRRQAGLQAVAVSNPEEQLFLWM
jgi:hypothetical protein